MTAAPRVNRSDCGGANTTHRVVMALEPLDPSDTRQLAAEMVLEARQPTVTNFQFVIGLVISVVSLGVFASWLLW